MFTCSHCKNEFCYIGDVSEAPAFCPTRVSSVDQELERYDEEDRRMARAAAIVEGRYYGMLTRVEEIMEFALQMGYHHIGVGFCGGLMAEAKVFVDILRANGFQVDSINCKNGSVEKTLMGVDQNDFVHCERADERMCNPAGQAEKLDAAGCELNVLVGLCVGHDSLFIKHSKAPVTVLAAKDRVLGHNPIAAIYTADSYRKSLYHYVENREKIAELKGKKDHEL